MNKFFSALQNSQTTQNPAILEQKDWRESFILSILRIAAVLGVVFAILTYPTSTAGGRILFTSLYAILLIIAAFPLPYAVRAYALLALSYIIGLSALLKWGSFVDGGFFLFAFVLFAALFFKSKVDIFALVISMATILAVAIFNQMASFRAAWPNMRAATPYGWLVYGLSYSSFAIVAMVAIEQLKKEFVEAIGQLSGTFKPAQEGTYLERAIQERAAQLEVKTMHIRSTANIARNIAEIDNTADLLKEIVNSAAEKFGYHHVGLYLLDERKNAFLQASSSAVGQELIGQVFQTETGARNILNLVVEKKRPYTASETGGIFIKDPNFPIARSRMILPLSVRGETIGLLDIHSEQIQAFSQEDAEIIQTLADLAAISIDNIRLVAETKNLGDQLDAYTAARTQTIWSTFTSRRSPAYQYTPAGVRPLFSKSEQDNADEALHVPLVLHGQSIGAIKLRRKGMTTNWSDKERGLIEKIADQVALALENSRLVDETQKSAQRDQMIANLSSRVRETLDMESVARTAANELRKVFDLKEAEVSVGAPQAEPLRVRKNTSSLRLK